MSRFSGSFLLLCLLFYFSMAFQTREPDAATTAKISKLLAARFGQNPRFSRKFLYNRVDLNNDGKNEILLGLLGSEFCDNSGCKLLILNDKYAVIGSVSKVSYPVYIEPQIIPNLPFEYANLFFYAHENDPKQINWSGDSYQADPITSTFKLTQPLEIIHKALNVSDAPIYEF